MVSKKETQTEEMITAHEEVGDDVVDFATSTLSGDMADAILGRIKIMHKPWQQCSQAEQAEIVNHTREVTKHTVRRAAQIIAGNGRNVIVMKCEKVDVKAGLKVTASCHKTQQALLDLGMSEGNTIMFVISNEDDYLGERSDASSHTDPDQVALFDHIQNEGGVVHSAYKD